MAKHTGPPESRAEHAASADRPAHRSHSDSGQDFTQGVDADVDPTSAAPPARFGRLALWIASASALTVGVVATLAYGVWFDQDQRTYAKAMAVAQQTLATGVAVVPEQASPAAGVAIVPKQASPATGVAIVPEQASPAAGLAIVPEQASPAAGAATVPAQQTAWSGHVTAPLQAPSASPSPLADADLTTSSSLAQPGSTEGAPPDSLAAHSSTAQPATLSGSAKPARHHPPPRLKPDNSLFARMQSFFHRVSYRQHGNGSQRDLYAHS